MSCDFQNDDACVYIVEVLFEMVSLLIFWEVARSTNNCLSNQHCVVSKKYLYFFILIICK